MKWLRVGYSLVLLCYFTLTMAYLGHAQEESGLSEEQMIRYLREIKRSQWLELVCGKWDDWCVPGSQRPALTCCKELTCKCTLWNTNCKCRSSLFTGK
ncbi:hypothetical protein LSAT2_012622 [Lamellibrachia satsuma]|nr:hypothetical protein LSAT2_012622 [Lamellibrachia satsuma]